MNDNTTQPADAEPELTTPEQLETELKAADIITVELINETKAKPPALQSAQLEAAHTFRVINGYLSTLRAAYENVVIDTSTTAGLDFAKQARLKLKTLRTRSDKLRLESNAPFSERIDAQNDAQRMIEDIVRPLEKRFDDAIKAQERAVAQRRLDEEAAATLRAANITAALSGISVKADDVMDLTSAELAVRIQEVTLHELNEEDFGPRFSEAVSIKDRTIARLESARAKAETNEANARQVLADRERHEAERKEREEREAREAKARELMTTVNEVMLDASRQTIEELRAAIEAMVNIDPIHFEPLRGEGEALIDRVLPALRQILEGKIAAEAKEKADKEAAEKRAKEDAARNRIAGLKAMVADAVGASSACIAGSIAMVDALLMADFEPFAKEAEEEQGRVRTSLEKLRIAAESEERTLAERLARHHRKEEVQDNLNKLNGIAAALQAQGFSSASVKAASDAMVMPTAEQFDDRLDEAIEAYDAQKKLLSTMFTLAEKHEIEAKAKAEADQREREEAQRKQDQLAAEEAMKTRREQVLRANAAAMFDLLESIRNDEGYAGISAALRADIDGLTSDIVAKL